MKKTLITASLTLAAMVTIPALATAADGPYVSGHLGYAMPQDSKLTDSTAPGVSLKTHNDSGIALALAVGYAFGPVRAEGEIAHQKTDFDRITETVAGVGSPDIAVSGDIKATSFLLNGYYDFHNDSQLTPYLTAGLGLAKVKGSLDSFTVEGVTYPVGWSDSDTVFAYQIGAGLAYAINQNLSLDARYRYFKPSDVSFTTTKATFSSHNIMLGARYNF